VEKMRYYLTAEPDPVVPLAGELVQLLRVVVEQYVQDILVSQLDATLQKYSIYVLLKYYRPLISGD
jgi:hypothetical protein